MSDLFPYRIETDRLELEHLCRENVDLFTYYELCAADDDIEEVTRHLYWDSPRTVMDARELLNNEQRSWEEGTKASYLVRPFEADEDEYGGIAGCAKLFVDWDRDVGELGVWLRKRFWGRGYAAERADALLELVFDRLDLSMVEAKVADDNERSRRATEKHVDRYGGRRDGLLRRSAATGYYCTRVVDEHRYTISRAEYEAAIR